MTPYEMMLSESQERMLMVLKPGMEAEAEAIFVKWGLDFAVIGHTTDTLRFVIKHNGETVADLPIKELGDEAPLYDRPHIANTHQPVIAAASVEASVPNAQALERLIGSPELASKRWVYEQYDHFILGNTVQKPGGDAAIVRVEDGPKGLALTTDVTPRYCEADPVEGGRQAVAEAWRNITAVGGRPLAITDNLNFGNPEKPEVMGQLVGCLKGIGEACLALDFPVVSGNVSLYNETNGIGILPTPTIGGVGVMDDVERHATVALKREDDVLVLIGRTEGWLGQSLYLSEIAGREEGAPPPVDLAVERRNGDFVRSLIVSGIADTVHDLSDGGLAVALAEMAMAGGIGAALPAAPDGVPVHAFLFGEDQGRYLIAVPAEAAADLLYSASAQGIDAATVGIVGGDDLVLPGEETISVASLKAAHEGWFPAYMASQPAAPAA
jgi:phosphoribosylformylglycinamidine synthase